MDLEQLKKDTKEILVDVLAKSRLHQGQILVLGMSSSEVAGGQIGKASNIDIAEAIVQALLDELNPRGIYLAVQGCERELADKKELEIVNVLPSLHAGGAGQLAAFKYFKDPVEVEFITAQAGLDIGDTSVGMHVKHVQVPIRPVIRELGEAHVTALASRPKLIGGARALYLDDPIRKS